MKYSKKDLEQSKQAYLRANQLETRMDGKHKDTVDNVETCIWLLFGMLAFLEALLFGYGTASEGLISLLPTVVVLSPAVVFSGVRRIVQSIIRKEISFKRKQGKLYVEYYNDMSHIRDRYADAIEKVVEMVKENDKGAKAKALKIKEELDKAVARMDNKYQSGSQEQIEAEMGNDFENYVFEVAKGLSPEQKKNLKNIFLAMGGKEY